MSKSVPKNESYNATFGGLLLMMKDYVFFFLRSWKFIVAFCILGGLFGGYLASKSTTSYTAKLTFMLNEEEGGSGGIENILGTLGLSGGGANSSYNLPKILELASSMRILQKVFFQKVKIGQKEDYFANHFLRVEQQNKKSKAKENTLVFKNDNFDEFTLQEKGKLKSLHQRIVGSKENDGVLTNSLSKDSRILMLSLQTGSEELSVKMLKAIFNELSDYYITKTVEKQNATFEAIQAEADSIRGELRSAEYQLAKFVDTRQDLVSQRSKLKRSELQRKILLFSSIYGESIKNLELAKFNLKQKTPFIQAIDLPFRPLSPSKVSLMKCLLLGVLSGVVLSCVLLLCYRICWDAIRAEQGSSPDPHY